MEKHMTSRERFLRTAEFNEPDRPFLLQPWPWEETTELWKSQGLPQHVKLTEYFKTDLEETIPLQMQGKYGPHLHPPLERKVIEETEEHLIVYDEEGNTVKLLRSDPMASMPQWISYPMSGWKDWKEIIKPRLNAKIPGRKPEGNDWLNYVKSVQNHDYPLGLWAGSLYGWPRSFMGVETISYMLYDEPALIHEMCNHIADFVIELINPILKEIQIDYAFVWEDMAGKSGPLCSPEMYREFMGQPLKRITDMFHNNGVDIIIIDSDGYSDPLIPVWLECGITGLRPFEIAAGSDAVKVRKEYGKNFILQGAIDKRMLAKGPREIDKEILSKVPWLCIQGGFFPQVDHLVPPDVSLENYAYYSDLLYRVVCDPEKYLHEAIKRGYWEK
jgi:uroporphyrinogen decarboxylase